MARSWNPFARQQFIKKEWCCKWDKPISVNFIGLFDPVDMSLFNINTSVKHDNINAIYSIQSDSRSVTEQAVFQPQRYEGEERVKIKRNHAGSRTKHGDIGGTEKGRSNDAYQHMKDRAQKSGLEIQ